MLQRRQELATGVINGKVYVIGGYDADAHSTGTVQVYNPITDTWTFAQALPIAVNHNAAAVVGGKLYSFGAGVGQTFAYDPNNNSWAARASSHYVHRGTAAVGVINGKIYVAGGEGTPSQRELEVYDPVVNTWTVKARMSVPRNHTAGGVMEWEILCCWRPSWTVNQCPRSLQSADQYLVHISVNANASLRFRGGGREQ